MQFELAAPASARATPLVLLMLAATPPDWWRLPLAFNAGSPACCFFGRPRPAAEFPAARTCDRECGRIADRAGVSGEDDICSGNVRHEIGPRALATYRGPHCRIGDYGKCDCR